MAAYHIHNCPELKRLNSYGKYYYSIENIDYRIYCKFKTRINFHRIEGNIFYAELIIIYHPGKLLKPLDDIITDATISMKETDDRAYLIRVRNKSKEVKELLKQFEEELAEFETRDNGEFGLSGDWWKNK